eukprot:CAMPEP_0172440022 /NCGR_PEP_ID=MMETSP1065-20121228/824_1 /TAXON_ID=265537 /ORGANISM="Amphiprora paludosa, Strain CCMP125" /LENGTH=167 /DNA_ID=CAMNT_0013188801 /DNA_START=154 /DNA_END=657 /DNA_ORIENTATION=-
MKISSPCAHSATDKSTTPKISKENESNSVGNHPSTTKLDGGEDAFETDENSDALDWDDDDFEIGELPGPSAVPAARAKDAKTSDKGAYGGIKSPNDDNDDSVDDWLSPIDSIEKGADDQSASAIKEDEFLTNQFERLRTPASKKKSRCAICTRPVQQKGSKLCNQHL